MIVSLLVLAALVVVLGVPALVGLAQMNEICTGTAARSAQQ
jgi:hypothetical protein